MVVNQGSFDGIQGSFDAIQGSFDGWMSLLMEYRLIHKRVRMISRIRTCNRRVFTRVMCLMRVRGMTRACV